MHGWESVRGAEPTRGHRGGTSLSLEPLHAVLAEGCARIILDLSLELGEDVIVVYVCGRARGVWAGRTCAGLVEPGDEGGDLSLLGHDQVF